jgi:hypothetical protein
LSQLHAAVHLSSDGKAEAMILPYYTVANGLTTLLTIDNTTVEFKALKIHLREAKKGDSVYSFNLYLSPKDMWAAGITNINDIVNIISNDESCTLNLNNLIGPPSLIPNDAWEWQTGMIEIIEMGVVDTSQFDGMNDSNRCQMLNDAWEAEGPNSLWRADGTHAMMPVSGGLHARASVIDVSNGFSFDVPLVYLDHFYPNGTIDNQPPESALPDLSSGDRNSLLFYEGEALTTEWPTGYEAVSALMMKTTLENQFETNAAYGAQTEWVISFPTARYHLNDLENDFPFGSSQFNDFNFPGDLGWGWTAFNRESYEWTFQCFVLCPPIPPNSLDHFVNTYMFNTDNNMASLISGSQRSNVRLFNILNYGIGLDFGSGKVHFNLNDYYYTFTNDRGMNALSQKQQIYHGLPVIGFAFQQFRNANAQPGLLATYATAKAHYGNQVITEEE